MINLFFGYFLILLNYDVTIAGITFDVIFDFVGYAFLAKGAKELADQSGYLKKTVMSCKIMTVVTLVTTVLFAIPVIPIPSAVKSAALLALELVLLAILYYQVKGISEIETATGYFMKGHKLRRDWMILAVAMVVRHISIYGMVSVIASYAVLIFSILLLLDIYGAINAYNGKVEKPVAEPKAASDENGDADDGEPEIAYIAEETEEEEK